MRKIRLSDTDIEFFDMEVSPTEFLFFTKHKDAFRCMWREQGKPFWTRFIITFRSYTVKQGVIKQMSFDSPKLNDLLDQGFINMHEQFLEGNATTARSFVDDIARLAQNHDKFPNLDSKNFAKDPFYCRDTRELFRQFFGSPDQKSSYLKVYILSPVYLRFGGSVCRCLKRWMEAPPTEITDDSYWTPPVLESDMKKKESKVIMCSNCLDECGTLYFQEKLCGKNDGPKFIDSWTKGDPRFNDKKNPLYNKIANADSDWRSSLTVEDFRDFVFYANNKYGEKCSDCLSLTNNCPIHNCTDTTEKKKRKRKKKKKEKEVDSTKKEDELEKLVNHIEGTAPLDIMPENTAGGAKSPTKETSPTDDKSTAKKEIFTKRAKISDDFKYGILPYQDKSGADLKRSVIGGFKVKRIEDERTGACEITVTITTIKGEGAKDRTPKLPGLEKNYDPRKINRFPLTADLLRTKMIDLPKKMEWYEGWNWCASVMNFEEEELCANPTNFTIKVTGREEECVKRTMFKLLFYVIQRKCRPCPGWNMEDDDIVACILPDESTEFEGITICIIRGFRFEERLTDEEKRTMQSPPEECIAKSKKVMMTWQPSKARSILKAPPAMGRAELKELLLNVGSIVNRVDEIPDDCSPQRRRQLELKIQKQMAVLKARPPRKIDEGPMYIQMKQNPDTFELFIMSNSDKVDELESIGMMAVDVDIDENTPGNVCENCCQPSISCQCMDNTGKKRQLPECNCVSCLKEICVGALAGDFDYILAKDGIVKENGKYVVKSAEQIKADIQVESKNDKKVSGEGVKKIVLEQTTNKVKADGKIITKRVAQSIPQAKVIKIDRQANVEKTIEEIKIQTTIYRHDAKRTASNKKKGSSSRNSPEIDGKDSESEHELRQQRIKELERERSALRKMVMEERKKEVEEKQAAKVVRRKEIESKLEQLAIAERKDGINTESNCTKSKGDSLKSGNKVGKKPVEENKIDTDKNKHEKKKIEIEIQIPFNESELPKQDPFKVNEKFVRENPLLLKQIADALESSEQVKKLNAAKEIRAAVEKKYEDLSRVLAEQKEDKKLKTFLNMRLFDDDKSSQEAGSDGKDPAEPNLEEKIKAFLNIRLFDDDESSEEVGSDDKDPAELKEENQIKAFFKARLFDDDKSSQEVRRDDKDSDFSVLKETEKTYNMIKKLGTKMSDVDRQRLIEASKSKEIISYDGMKADIILTGEPTCPCQLKEKELMKAKLKKKKTLKESKETTTLKQELSHRLNCPEQLSVREEKPSLTASRPPRLANDPTIDISEIIEEQLIDSFNIKRIVKLGMKISQNATTQTHTDSDGVKPFGFKEKIITAKPWTKERSKCIEEKDPDFDRYLRFIDYKQDPRMEIGVQTENDNDDNKGDVQSTSDKQKLITNDGDKAKIIDGSDTGKGKIIDGSDTGKGKRIGSPENNNILSRLRKCANCGMAEPAPKTYMKCQKCKLEGIANARYYCGRECQVKDWITRHKKEHKGKIIK